MSASADLDRRRARRLFLVVLGLSAFHGLFLIADRRVPLGHETGRLFGLQRAFASGAAAEPGDGRTWVEQGTLLQNAVLPISSLLRRFPFLPMFHLGMFIEELLLLVGVWLLSSKYYRSPYSQFVVSVAALGSSLWIDHAAVNLLAFSALPLILYLLHEFLETRARLPLLIAGVLSIVQILGRPPAFALLVPAATAFYLAGAALLFGVPLRDRRSALAWERRDAGGAVVLFAAALAVGGTLLDGAKNAFPPSASEGLTFNAAVTGAGLRNPVEYLDLVLGFSPSLDATSFCGYFTLAFAAIALGSLGPKAALRLVGFLVAALMALGMLPLLLGALLSIPARPTPQGMSLVRLFVIILAGFGFERMMELRALKAPLPGLPTVGLLLTSGVLALLFVFIPYNYDLIASLAGALSFGTPAVAVSPFLLLTNMLSDLAGAAALMSGLAGGALLLWSSGWRRTPLALCLILFLHPLDTFGWKFRMTWMKSCSLSPARASALTLQGEPSDPALDLQVPAPPSPAYLEKPYGCGPTPLGDLPLNDGAQRHPLGRLCSWAVALLSVMIIGWTIRQAASLAWTGKRCPGIP